MPIISFLILTYNSSPHLANLFESIEKVIGEQVEKGIYEIIIVDNSSSDSTREVIKKYTNDHIKFFANSTNNGYAKGINIASSKAQGKYIVVVNPDAKLLDSDFKKVVEAFERNPKIGIIGMNVLSQLGVKEKTAGKFFNPLTFALYCLGLDDFFGLRFSPESLKKVDFVSGGFIAIRKDVFDKVGGFDEDYFMYVEDMDICYRLSKMGFSVYFAPFASIVHKGQGSSNREFAIVSIYKGLVTFYKKHASLIMLEYVKSLLSVKATLIIFLGSIFGKKELAGTYTKALKAIS